MKIFFEKIFDRIFRQKATLFFSIVMFCISSLLIWSYYNDKMAMLYQNHFVPHFAAVFFEVGLAILIVEEVIKSKRKMEEKREKRMFFMNKMQDKKLDKMLYEFLKKIEENIQLPENYRKQNGFQKYGDADIRLKILERNGKYFDHTMDIRALLKEKKIREVILNGIIQRNSGFLKKFRQLLEIWNERISDVIESISLTSFPHNTKYYSWDHIVGLHIQIQKLLRTETLPAAHTAEEKLLQKQNLYLAVYILTMKAYVLLLMDYRYDFRVHNFTQSHNFEFIEKAYQILKKF